MEAHEISAVVTRSPGLDRPDERFLEMPVRTSRSDLGAPVFDASGNVLGLAEPSVRADMVAKVMSPPPGDLTFAVRASLASLMLRMNGIAYTHKSSLVPMNADKRSAWMHDVSVAIECWKVP